MKHLVQFGSIRCHARSDVVVYLVGIGREDGTELMMSEPAAPKGLPCGCPEERWPPVGIGGPPPPPAAPPGNLRYALRGSQIEPEAAFWTLCRIPCVVRMEDLVKRTDKEGPCFFRPYPTDPGTQRAELDELIELASLRDDPHAVYSADPDRLRKGISPFLQLRPQPVGAVVNIERDPILGAIRDGRQPDRGAIDIARGRVTDPAYPVIRTGRELARYFESETPGLAHRLALNELIRQQNWSPPRQAMAWAALDVAIYSALLAAWHYKWAAHIPVPGIAARGGVSYRPRPIEVDYRVSVLYNRQVADTGVGDDGRRLLPDPSPGTPRHPAYPSGHSTYAGAASEMLSYFFPDYTEELDRLADNVGMARLWAGIHWRSDHVEGMQLGRCVARMIIEQLEDSCVCPADPCPPVDNCAPPPKRTHLRDCAQHFQHCCAEAAAARKDVQPDEQNAEGEPPEGEPLPENSEAVEGQPQSAAASQAATREQAAGSQEGAPATRSSTEERRQAAGPQEGGSGQAASDRLKEQAAGPQEGAR